MGLGHSAEIRLAVRNLAESAAFYQQLGFRRVGGEDTAPRFHDGVLTIVLAGEPGKTPVLTYATTERAGTVAALKAAGIEVSESEGGASFEDPNGLTICLRDAPLAFSGARGSFNKCGDFVGLAVPVKDLAASVAFWMQFGFERLSRGILPYPWEIVFDCIVPVALHQCGDFATPHLSYCSPDAAERIAGLKEDGLTFHDETRNEQGVVNGGTLIAPDGQRIFVQGLGSFYGEQIGVSDERPVDQGPWRNGEAIYINSGPFFDFNGVIDEVRVEEQKVVVTLGTMNPVPPIELDFDQIERI